MTETWADIAGYEGYYSISSRGRVRSHPRSIQASDRVMKLKGRILKTTLSTGYPSVKLCKGIVTFKHVHRLVAEAFLGTCPFGHEVLHENGDATDPSLENLRYGTRRENVADAQLHGTHVKGESVGNSILTEALVLEIVERLNNGEKCHVLSKAFGVSRAAIQDIKRGKNWSWLTGIARVLH